MVRDKFTARDLGFGLGLGTFAYTFTFFYLLTFMLSHFCSVYMPIRVKVTDRGIINWLLKFADNTKLFGKVQTQLDYDGLQKDLQRLLD